MKEKKENEELQSRREFFKRAAKSALPIIGAIALSNLPSIAKTSNVSKISNSDSNAGFCSWCSYGCGDGCTSCVGTCVSCVGSCLSCLGGCWGYVYY